MKATTIESEGGPGGLESEEPDLLAYHRWGDAVSGIDSVDAHSSSMFVAQYDVDTNIADDIENCSPNIVR